MQSRPAVTYDPQLPITARVDEIAAAIERHPVVVVCGETGSGKSTQLPKICLGLGRGVNGLIGHTQPRRIAARSVASRLAQELGSSVGQAVGFKVRFTDSTSPNTYVKLMTDGILLAETQGDRFLDQYDTIIIDEAHERSLNIDFLLGYLKRLLPKRPDLRVVITSATIDAARFCEHFASELGPAPLIEVSGRTYPVEVWYRSPHDAEDDDEPDRTSATLDAIDELLAHDHWGDILVFLSTEREILETSKALRGRLQNGPRECEILPLYARLSVEEQNRVFQGHTRRRIVLATNVAESSLTVPGIRYVVDNGLARISRYAARSKIQRLPIEPISQASAEQRKGRCGRLGPGICVRLYSEDDFAGRERFTQPEIRRANLASVILQAESLKLGAIEEFPFLDPPQSPLIRDGYATLFELGAVDAENRITPLGQRLSRLPVDPRIGRMILAAIDEGCLREMLVIASALEVQDPRERPVDKKEAADQAHSRWNDPHSDFLTWLNIWRFFHDLKDKLSRNQLRKACHQNFLSPNRLREWQDIHRQLQQLVESSLSVRVPGGTPADFLPRDDNADPDSSTKSPLYAPLHRSILAGMLSNIAVKTDSAEYQGAGNLKLFLWPGSGVFESKPLWIVAGELVETTRRYARTCARVQPEWIEPLAAHLVKRSYSDPHWRAKSGSVQAHEKVTLFGLTIVSQRLVPYGPIDPELSRELFIRHALVGAELRNKPPFLEHNRRLREEAERLAAKTRRGEWSVDDFALFGFYNRKLPADVWDEPRLNRWRRDVERADPQRLYMTLADVAAEETPPPPDEYPDRCKVDRMNLPLEYRFEPGADDDGITMVVPREGLGQVAPERLGWLVPGLLEQKITALIRGLPKSLRRNLIPVPDTAKKVLQQLRFGEGRFLDNVAKLLSQAAGESISVDVLAGVEIPDHLRMNVRVVDGQGKKLGESRDLNELRAELGVKKESLQAVQVASPWHKDKITRWDFGALPESVDLRRGDLTLAGFPALVDARDSVSLRLLETREHADWETRRGVRRLVALAEHRALKAHVDWFPNLNQLVLFASGVYGAAEFREDVALLIADRAFLDNGPLPRSADDFQVLLQLGRKHVEEAVQDVVRVVGPLMKNYHAARVAIDDAPRVSPESIEDARVQLGRLMVKNVLVSTPWTWLQHLPRYLDAIRLRLQKLVSGGLARDRQAVTQLAPLTRRYIERAEAHARQGTRDPELETYRWWLEEFRVSLFAQQLGTALPISAKRLDQQWAKVGAV